MIKLRFRDTKDRRQFEETALPYLNELFGTALRLTKNEKDAEDLVQDTFLKAYTFFHRFEQGTNCRAWLFKILTNTFINNYRRKVKEREVLSANLESGPIHDNFYSEETLRMLADPEQGIVGQFLSDDVKKAIDSLPTEFRMVVILADLQEFSYKEIASILGCPVGTVMSRLFRGRRLLRKQLLDFAIQAGIIKPCQDDEERETAITSRSAYRRAAASASSQESDLDDEEYDSAYDQAQERHAI